MSAQLKSKGYHVGRRKTQRFMNEMDIYPIYPKMNLSKRMQQAKVCPYLLRNAIIDKSGMVYRHYIYSDQAWLFISDSHYWLAQPLYRRLGSRRYSWHQNGHKCFEKGIHGSQTADTEFWSGMPVYKPAVDWFSKGQRNPAEHGWQKPLGRQHYDWALVSQLQVWRSLPDTIQ